MNVLNRYHIGTRHILIAILLLATLLRFWNFSSRISLGGDSARDAFVAAHGSAVLQLPLTGPFSSLGQFTFGPWYYYELILAERITNNPYAPWIFLNLVSIATVYFMYLFGKRMVNTEVGLLVALLVSIAPAQLSAAKGLTNPNLVSLFATGSLVLFLSLLEKRPIFVHQKAWGLGVMLGLGVNHHYQMAGMLLLPIFLLFRRGSLMLIIEAYVGVAITFLPLLFFDLNNHWYTLRHLFETYIDGKNRIYVPNRWLFYLRDFWPQFWAYTFGVPVYVAVAMIVGAALVAIRFVAKKKFTIPWISVLLLFGIQFFMLRYYWGERFMGYLQYLHPYVFLATAIVLWQTKILPMGKYVYPLIVFLVVIASLPAALRELRPEEFYVNIVSRVDTLEKLYPSSRGYRLYSCDRSGWDYTQAMGYVLHMRGKLQPDGVAIGIPTACVQELALPSNLLPTGTKSITTLELTALRDTAYPFIPDFSAVDISQASDSARERAGFAEVSLIKIYNSTVRWWFNEQP